MTPNATNKVERRRSRPQRPVSRPRVLKKCAVITAPRATQLGRGHCAATSRADLTKHMMSPDFLDAAKFPTATFESTKVVATGNTAKITGNLTLLGVTKPVVLDATFTGAGNNPMNKKATIGFHGSTTIKRSDFGMAKYVPMVGDDVKIAISIAFEK